MQQSNYSGNNHNYKFPFSTFSQKWTRREDERLRKAVQKYGTQWTFIAKRYRFNRSINSLVKRWHGKLKEGIQNDVLPKLQESESEQQIQQVADRSKRTRKEEKKEQKKHQSRQDRKQQRKQDKKEQVKEQRRQVRNGSRTRKQRLSMTSRVKQQNEKPVKKQVKSNQSQNEKNEDDQIDSFSEMDFDQYVFQNNWKETDDYLLKESVLTEKILNWEELSLKLRIPDIKEIKKRWQIKIYPTIVDSRKIGGCVKYSQQEDSILSRGVKLGLSINELRRFLPGRTPYSLDARRRRTLRMQERQVPQLRFWTKRLSLYKFVQKRHQHLQKPAEEQFFLYKSDSQ